MRRAATPRTREPDAGGRGGAPMACLTCGRPTDGSARLCADCLRLLADRLGWLLLVGMPSLRDKAYRRVSLDDGRQRRASTAFPSTPFDEDARQTMLDDERDIALIAGILGLKPYGWDRDERRYCLLPWDRSLPILARSAPLIGLLDDADTAMSLTARAYERTDRQLTRDPERILWGICPACARHARTGEDGTTRPVRTPIYAPRGRLHAPCPRCGTDVDLLAARRDYVSGLKDWTIDASPKQASEWLADQTGVHVTGKTIHDWMRTGRLPRSRRLARGLYRYDVADLLNCLTRQRKPDESENP